MRIKGFNILLILLIASVMAQGGDGGNGAQEQKECFRWCSDEYICNKECGQDTECKKRCLKRQEDYGETIKAIFGSIVGILLLGLFISLIGLILETKQICYYHPYRKLKRKYNKVGAETMLREEFVSKRDLVINSLRKSSKQNNFYFFERTWSTIHISEIKIINEKNPLMTQIKMKGEDRRKWTARGYIMSKNNQIFMWFMKQYEKINSDSLSQEIVYISTEFGGRNTLMSGTWSRRINYLFDGSWTLEYSRMRDQTAMSEQIIEI